MSSNPKIDVQRDSIKNYDNLNVLSKHSNFINNTFRDCLFKGHLAVDSHSVSDYSKDGFFVVTFSILNLEREVLVYNYIYYPNIFRESFYYYTINRNNYLQSLLYREFGDCMFVLSSDKSGNLNGIDNESINKYNEYFNNSLVDINNSNSLQLETIKDIMSHKSLLGSYLVGSYKELFLILNKSNFIASERSIIELLFCGFYRDYIQYLVTLTGFNDINFGDRFHDKADNFYRLPSILNGTMFIVDNISSIVKGCSNKGIILNQGSQSLRGRHNKMQQMLGCLDIDYRNSLYNHYHYHTHHKDNATNLSYLSRDKFSFRNIHNSISGVRWYSTTRNLRDNRQSLFQESYRLIQNVIDKDGRVGTPALQRKIEDLLYSQETSYHNDNMLKIKINYDNDVYDFILNKRAELVRYHNNPTVKKVNSRSIADKYASNIVTVVNELGVETIVDILLEYFMEIVSTEILTIKEEITPGIPELWAYGKLGGKIYNKFLFNRYKDSQEFKDGKGFSEYKNNNREYLIYLDDNNFYTYFGGDFINSLYKVLLIERAVDTNVSNKLHKTWYCRLTDDTRKLMLNKNRVYHLPSKLPMVCPPKKYANSNNKITQVLGGYLLNDYFYTKSIFKDKVGYQHPTTLEEDNIIEDLVNGLAATPYKINKETLEFIYQYGEEKEVLNNFYDKDLTLREENRRKFTQFCKSPYKSNKDLGILAKERKSFVSMMSKNILEQNILSIATVYSDMDKIYFPVRLDHRTRIYCETDYFDYQKTDLAKGLINFSTPGEIFKHDSDAINYFKAFGANMFGNSLDKKSLKYRVKWVDDNSDQLLNFKENDIVNRAENKSCFISFCFEYSKFVDFMNDKDSVVFNTYLPIQLDASCNGYQHLTLLTKETRLYDKLNLSKSSTDDDPQDFYTYIVNKVSPYIKSSITTLVRKKRSEDEQKKLESLRKIDVVAFTRDIVKLVIMTKSYNAGIPKLVDFLIKNLTPHEYEEYDESKGKVMTKLYYTYKDNPIKIYRYDLFIYAVCLVQVIDIEAPKIKWVKKYLSTVASICSKVPMPVPWKLPSGAIISESYMRSEVETINAFSFIKTKHTFRKFVKDEYETDKHIRATMPNLIHSLDATTIAFLYRDFKNKGPMYTIHDCFAVTADKVPSLINTLKMVYLSIYSSNNYLKQFDDFIRETLHEQLDRSTFDGKHLTITDKYNKPRKYLYPDISKLVSYRDEHMKHLTESAYLIN